MKKSKQSRTSKRSLTTSTVQPFSDKSVDSPPSDQGQEDTSSKPKGEKKKITNLTSSDFSQPSSPTVERGDLDQATFSTVNSDDGNNSDVLNTSRIADSGY